MKNFINWIKKLFGISPKHIEEKGDLNNSSEEQLVDIEREVNEHQVMVEKQADAEQERIEREAEEHQAMIEKQADAEQERIEKEAEEHQAMIEKQADAEQERIEKEAEEHQAMIEREAAERQATIEREADAEQERVAKEAKAEEEKNRVEQEKLKFEKEISENFIVNGGSLGPIVNINNYTFDGELDYKYPDTPGVYIVSNIENKEVLYVGQSSNLRRRFAEHIESGKFSKYKIVFEFISMPGASYNQLNETETELIEELKPSMNVQKGGGNTNKKMIITYTDWNGRGMIKSFSDVSEMRGYIVGITGKVQGYTRKDIVSTLQEHGVDIKDKRKAISTDLWIVGKDGKVGAVKNEMIEDRDYVMTHNNIVDIMNKIK